MFSINNILNNIYNYIYNIINNKNIKELLYKKKINKRKSHVELKLPIANHNAPHPMPRA